MICVSVYLELKDGMKILGNGKGITSLPKRGSYGLDDNHTDLRLDQHGGMEHERGGSHDKEPKV
jgi:hypothetical protein